MTYLAILHCSMAFLRGAELQTHRATASNGLVVDWSGRDTGRVVHQGGDAFDTARAFVKLVGEQAAMRALRGAAA